MKNLQEIIPAFFVGPGGKKLTPEQIEARNEIAKTLLAKATDVTPNAGKWTSVAAKGLMGFAAGRERKIGEKAAAANAEANSSLSSSLLGSLLGPSSPSSGGWNGMAPTETVSPVASALVQSPQMVENQPPIPGLSAAPSDMSIYRDAIASIESDGSGGYAAVGPTNQKLGRALGRYQIMEANIPAWSKEVLGREVTADEFLANPQIQDAIFDGKFSSYVSQFGPEGAAQAWFAGPGGVGKTGRKDVLGTSVGEYGQKFSRAIGAAPTSASPGVEVAQVLSPQPSMSDASYFPPAPQAGGIDPAVIQALSDPTVSPQNKQIAMSLVEQYQAREQAAQKQAMQQAAQQQEIQRRRSIAQSQGFDPALAEDEIAYKAAVEAASRGPQTVTVGNQVFDVRNPSTPLITGPESQPTSVQEYNFYANQMTQAGQQPMDYNSWALQKAGASAQTNIGSIPAGMMLERDGASMRLVPIPGSQAAMDAERAAKAEVNREGQRGTSGDVVTGAAINALNALNAEGMPATGTVGRVMSMLPESNAAEVRRQVEVLKANASMENIQAMRAASPTGAALGAASDADLRLLQSKTGALDPDSPNFERDLREYTRTLLETIYGREEGKKMFDNLSLPNGQAAPSSGGWTDIGGVKIRPKGGS